MPNHARPPEMTSSVVHILASSAGLRYVTPPTSRPRLALLVRAAIPASAMLPSSMLSSCGPIGGIWCRWSMTETEPKPLSSAVFAISARCSKRRSGGTSGIVEVRDVEVERDRYAHRRHATPWRRRLTRMRIRGLLVVLFLLALAAPRPRGRRCLARRGRDRGPAVPGPRQRRLRRPALRPRPALRDQRAGQPIDGTVTILARATQALSRFDLDFAGQSVGSVAVDGRRARVAARRRGARHHAASPAPQGRAFVVRVSHFVAVPTEPGDDPASTRRSSSTQDGSATAGQPFYEHLVYPSNDHPRDKASFTFRFDVPAGTTAVANGVPLGHWTEGGRPGCTCSASRWRPS